MGLVRLGSVAIISVLLAGSAAVLSAAQDSRLADAVRNGDMSSVQTLLKQHVDVNTQQADGMTALLWAAHNDDVAAANLLIRAGASAKLVNRYGIAPLTEAAINASTAMVDLLLKAGADPNTELPEGDTVLMLAARAGNPAVVKALLDKGANVKAKEDWHGETALAIAAGQNHAEVVKLLVDAGADPNAQATHLQYPKFKTGPAQVMSVYPAGGLTPLMQTARENAIEAAQVLVAAKADLNFRDPNKMTAMQIAITNEHWDFANMLLEAGADADDGSLGLAADIKNLSYVKAQTDRPNKLTAMDLINALLAKGAKVDTPFEGSFPVKATFAPKVTGPADATPLMRAAKTPDLEVMRLLIAKGADPKFAAKDGATALMVSAGIGPRGDGMAAAAELPNEDLMIEAIKLCMDKGADINTVDGAGMTALHGAASKGATQVVQFLADHGAKLDVKDKRERTALDIAKGSSGKGAPPMGGAPPPKPHPETAALLRKLMGLPAEDKATSESKPAGDSQDSKDTPKEVAAAQ